MRWCTDTSDLRHFGPKTFRHCVFGAEVSQIFALVPKCPLAYVSDSSALKCMRHFGPRIKICLSVAIVFRNADRLYIRYSNRMKVLGKRLTKAVSDLVSCIRVTHCRQRT